MGTELFYADRWTDMKKLKFAFRNFASASKTAPPLPQPLNFIPTKLKKKGHY
jgi:hypothetical protein